MRLALHAAAGVLLVVALSGCFQVRSLLSVRANGSATLRDEVTLTGMALMALAEGGGEGSSGFDREAFEARAAGLGEGVRLTAFEPREDGFTAVYEVPDLHRLTYSTPDVPSGSEGATGRDGVALSFDFDTGDPATLRVLVPKPAAGGGGSKPAPSETPAVDPEDQARMLGMMRAFLGEARLTVAVEVEGEILETTAQYVDGQTVTLFDLPFDALLDVFEARPELLRSEPPSTDAFYDLIDGVAGVEVERPGTVRVRFR